MIKYRETLEKIANLLPADHADYENVMSALQFFTSFANVTLSRLSPGVGELMPDRL